MRWTPRRGYGTLIRLGVFKLAEARRAKKGAGPRALVHQTTWGSGGRCPQQDWGGGK